MNIKETETRSISLNLMNEKVLEHYGIDAQIGKTIEELKELIEALYDYRKDMGNKDYVEHVEEEISDVLNMVAQISLYLNFGFEEKLNGMECKMKRTINRIELEGKS